MMAETIFWISILAILHAYFGYPIILSLLGARAQKGYDSGDYEPEISIIIPVHNEGAIIREKIENTLSLDYPDSKKEIIIVSDGSTDRTGEIVREYLDRGIRYFDLRTRSGKAAALNVGLLNASGSIIIFSDASIILSISSIRSIVAKFRNGEIGCVSGEDFVEGSGNEGMYGKYELLVRNLESRVNSIVGASGCFYAQRKSLCLLFPPGMAPDFYSVLVTVKQGFRAVSDPGATGVMKEVKTTQESFERKVRTYLRGMTTLMHFKELLNPFRYGFFSFQLLSHKLSRWLTGIFLIGAFCSNLFLLGSSFYQVTMLLQGCFYSFSLLGLTGRNSPVIRIPMFFILVNFSSLVAWVKYFSGSRQEVWEPSRR